MRATVGFSCQPDMLKEIDARAESLGFTRSQYIQMLVRGDLTTKGDMTVPVAAKKKRRK